MHWSICDFLADIAHNALHADPDRVEIRIEEYPHRFRFTVSDDGCGMSPEQQQRALDPFYSDRRNHPDRRVGLGLPMLVQTTEATGGSFSLESQQGTGTTVAAEFSLDNIDTPPIGDIAGSICSLMGYRPGPELIVVRRLDVENSTPREYRIARSELIDAVGDLEDVVSLGMAQTYIRSEEDWVKGDNNHGTNEP
ncbi:ATP-binding protein [Spirochaeta africana]|uniref:histidine kinase n=1 Tax=Spirochaeta africana (strain ATCC 700263 / DSM 8902 / Z-7692) TaxID=889378 RepID=H9ULP4_SPIAZ|nr:sensor histidine kinase [Spirochaeta africana]AFG38437.1 histidine kinase [Spirochaeta africana DSM 8902]